MSGLQILQGFLLLSITSTLSTANILPPTRTYDAPPTTITAPPSLHRRGRGGASFVSMFEQYESIASVCAPSAKCQAANSIYNRCINDTYNSYPIQFDASASYESKLESSFSTYFDASGETSAIINVEAPLSVRLPFNRCLCSQSWFESIASCEKCFTTQTELSFPTPSALKPQLDSKLKSQFCGNDGADRRLIVQTKGDFSYPIFADSVSSMFNGSTLTEVISMSAVWPFEILAKVRPLTDTLVPIGGEGSFYGVLAPIVYDAAGNARAVPGQVAWAAAEATALVSSSVAGRDLSSSFCVILASMASLLVVLAV